MEGGKSTFSWRDTGTAGIDGDFIKIKIYIGAQARLPDYTVRGNECARRAPEHHCLNGVRGKAMFSPGTEERPGI